MARNLYETSFKRHNISNYLFVATDNKSHKILQRHLINSVRYLEVVDSNKVSNYGSANFNLKTHLKIRLSLETLLLNFTAIIVDVDIVFFKDPLPYFDCKMCDIIFQLNEKEVNTGFYMARPTQAAISFFGAAWKIAQENPTEIDDQKIFNRELPRLVYSGKITIITLDEDLFPCGLVYFEKKQRAFYYDNQSNNEVMLHNNYIVSMEAKRYRFKELRCWVIDDNDYYSDPNRKYLSYENTIDLNGDEIEAAEKEALMSGLIISHLLNRTLILPSFACNGSVSYEIKLSNQRCSLNIHYDISRFDSIMKDNYREHVFLHSDLVPDSIKTKPETYYIIRRPNTKLIPDTSAIEEPHEGPQWLVHLTPSNITKGPTVSEIHNWFSKKQDPVIYFHSLYNILGSLSTEPIYEKIKKALSR